MSSRIAVVLPGRWRILASNLLHWLSGDHVHPVVEFHLSSAEPLVFAEEVRFATTDGKHRVVRSRDVWSGDSFVARETGFLRPGSRRWSLGGASDDGNIVVVRHRFGRPALRQSAMGTLSGIDVMVRDGADTGEVRALVAGDVEAFRLSVEEFASLAWLPETR